MNMRLYQATLQHLRSEALKSLGMIETILSNPPSLEENVTEIIAKHALNLVQYEGAIHSLETYFNVNAGTHPSPAPTSYGGEPSIYHDEPTDEESQEAEEPIQPLTVTPEMSATMRESLKRQFGDDAVEDVHAFDGQDVETDPLFNESPPDNEWVDDE